MHGYHIAGNQQAMRYLADLREALPRGTVTAVAAVAAVAAARSVAAAPKVEFAAAVWE